MHTARKRLPLWPVRRRARVITVCAIVLVGAAISLLRQSHLESDAASRSFRTSHGPPLKDRPSAGDNPLDRGVVFDPPPAPPLRDPDAVDTDDLFGPDSSTYRSSTGKIVGHMWDANGLLTVNPEAAHPIFELIRRAEARWAEKLRRASTTLEQAVIEYRRRYGREPPLGFDDWCAFPLLSYP